MFDRRNHYRDPYRVVHLHHVGGGAWCCIDIERDDYGPPIPWDTPLTCLWCITETFGMVI